MTRKWDQSNLLKRSDTVNHVTNAVSIQGLTTIKCNVGTLIISWLREWILRRRGGKAVMKDILGTGKFEYNLYMLLVPHPVSLYLVCAPILTFYPHSQLAANGSQLSPSSFSLIPQGAPSMNHIMLPPWGRELITSKSLAVGCGERQGGLGQFSEYLGGEVLYLQLINDVVKTHTHTYTQRVTARWQKEINVRSRWRL